MAKSYSTPTQLPLPIDGETAEIPLTRGYVAIVDAIDADLARYKWHAWINPQKRVYAHTNFRVGKYQQKMKSIHRLIGGKIVGRNLEKNEVVDHIDNNPLNNRRSNLRICTFSDNVKNKNRYSNNESGFKGVYKRDDKYRAQIQVNGKKIMLGTYNTPQEAYQAYCDAAKKYHGEFARF